MFDVWFNPAHWPDGYAMLMSPNKVETAVHGYHCPSDMVVRIRKALAIPRLVRVLQLQGIVIVNPSEKVHETEVILENRKYYYLRSDKTTKLNEYSRKRKRPPKVQRLSGRLQEVVVYKK